MSEIKNPTAYFAVVISNSRKDEYKANDNSRKYIIPVGGEIAEKADKSGAFITDDTAIFDVLSILSLENWLMTIESRQLYQGLSSLKKKDLEFLFVMLTKGFTQREMAAVMDVSQVAVCKRFSRIIKKLRKFF